MNAKHTPGKWSIDGMHIIGNGYSIAHINSHRTTEGRANASLIASAPETAAERDRLKEINAELLEACLAARGAIVFGDGKQIDWDGIATQLGRAIAKAKVGA